MTKTRALQRASARFKLQPSRVTQGSRKWVVKDVATGVVLGARPPFTRAEAQEQRARATTKAALLLMGWPDYRAFAGSICYKQGRAKERLNRALEVGPSGILKECGLV